MTDFLLYWKVFWKDLNVSNPFNDESVPLEEWHTEQLPFYNRVENGDNLWVVISGGKNHPEEWRLLQKIVVKRKRIATGNISRYGKYEVFGDIKKSLRFDFNLQPDFTPILHKLKFESRKRIVSVGGAIGNAIQKIRPLSKEDSILLNKYAKTLKRHETDAGFDKDIFSDNSLEKLEYNLRKFMRKGAGFGDPKTNKKVEESAISAVKKHYEKNGWKVKSVETEKCGYDLLCTKGIEENHVEVKGIQGVLPNFVITSGEVNKAQIDDNFLICAVTSALSEVPKLNFFTGKEFVDRFDLSPIAFRATLQTEL